MNNFIITNCDTDSIFFKKPDGSAFSEEESVKLLNSLNSLYPERIKWTLNGSFKKIITFKAKNYVLQTKDKIVLKGSAVRSPAKELALQEFIKEVIQAILDETEGYSEIYTKYVKEILNVKDIKRWSSRKTVTERTLNSERTNETKIKEAIENTEYSEGSRIWVYFKEDNTLALAEHFNNDYNKQALLKKLFQTSKLFDSVLEKGQFINYSLKKNIKLLETL